jgi:hypothetical protein
VTRLTRREAPTLRGAFRRAALGIPHRGTISRLVLGTYGTKLRAQHRYAGLAVEHLRDLAGVAPEAVALPLDPLAGFEGRVDAVFLGRRSTGCPAATSRTPRSHSTSTAGSPSAPAGQAA